jgi:hypothetical protein
VSASPLTVTVSVSVMLPTKCECMASGPMKELVKFDFGGPLHSLIIPATMHYLEEDMLRTFNTVGEWGGRHAGGGGGGGNPEGNEATSKANTMSLIEFAVDVLLEENADKKAEKTIKIKELWDQGAIQVHPVVEREAGGGGEGGTPARPARPRNVALVHPSEVRARSSQRLVYFTTLLSITFTS